MERSLPERQTVLAAVDGDGDAFGALYVAYVDRVFDVVRRITRDPEIAAEVAQDTFLGAYEQLGSLRDPDAFGGWLLRSARNRALNRLARERRSTGVDPDAPAMTGLHRDADSVEPTWEATDRTEMVWAASAALGAADASILHLHLRHGLGAADLADELGIDANAAHQRLFRLRKRLGAALGSWTLWRHGAPTCAELLAAIESAGTTRFDAATARLIDAHADACALCDAERERSVSPEALFAAVPVLALPAMVKAEVAGALISSGVPIPSRLTDIATYGSGAPDGLDISDPTLAPIPAPTSIPPEASSRRRRPALWLIAAAAVVVAVIAWGALGVGDGGTGDDETADGGATAGDATAGADGPRDLTVDPSTGEPWGMTRTTMEPSTSTSPTSSSVPQASTPATTPVTIPTPPPTEPTTTAGTQPDPVPVIESFTAQRVIGPGDCPSPSQRIVVTWETTDATSVTLTGPDGRTPVAVDGSMVACGAGPTQFELTATSPGGTTNAEPILVA